MKKTEKVKQPHRPLTPVQQACLQLGRDSFMLSCTSELVRFLKKNGAEQAAREVQQAVWMAKLISKANYKMLRKKLDPDWKDPWEETLTQLAPIDS